MIQDVHCYTLTIFEFYCTSKKIWNQDNYVNPGFHFLNLKYHVMLKKKQVLNEEYPGLFLSAHSVI